MPPQPPCGLRAESLARLLTAEVGKPLAGAQREAQVVATLLDFFAEEGLRIRGEIPQLNLPDERVLIVKEPVGVVVALNPSNYPLISPSWKLGAALAAGCTVVSKPSEDTPLAVPCAWPKLRPEPGCRRVCSM
ncbi:MAG: aldehyde dehydrogenase family protein [Anaerolineae bacterium]